MARMSGGGINSNKTVQSRTQKVEPKSQAGNIAGAAQQGLATQFKKEPLTEGPGYQPGAMPSTGMPGKYNSASQGPGAGRTVYGSGSQSTYGSINPGASPEPGRDILSDYGPERRR